MTASTGHLVTGSIRRHAALLVSVAGAVIVALDGTVLLVAQPGLRRDLGASAAQIQWTSTGYLVAVAALLVIAGRLGDRYGHPRVLLLGALGFGAASAGIALAPTIGWVIALRAVQGAFGALLQPATLALLRLSYPAERLSTPIALRTGAIGVAAGVGPILGGVLVAQSGWRAVFWVNVPVALLVAAFTVTAFTVTARPPTPEPPTPAPIGGRRLDVVGAVLLAGSLAVLVHALAGVPARGWGASATLLQLAVALCLLAVLVRHEGRATDPIVPQVVGRSAPVIASMALLVAVTAGLFGSLFTATFYLQDTLRLGPLACGLRMLPLTTLMVLGAPATGVALRRHGPRRTALTGTALVVLGIAGLSLIGPGSPWPTLVGSSALLGAGFAAVMVTATGTAVGDAPAGYAGVVGGLKQTAMNIGPTLGIAVAAGLDGTSAPTMGSALPVLAGCAGLGLVPAALLPPAAQPKPSTRRGTR